MEGILDFIKTLTPLQIVMVGVGLVILFPIIRDLFVKQENVVPKPEPSNDDNHNYKVSCLVKKWETLYICCEEQKLQEACDKLKEIFPMFVEIQTTKKTDDKAKVWDDLKNKEFQWPFA